MSKKELVEFSDEWLIEIVKAARNIFGDCIYIESNKHPCGWDSLSFDELYIPEDVLDYQFDYSDVTGGIYEDHEWDDLTLKEILMKNLPKWGFEGIG